MPSAFAIIGSAWSFYKKQPVLNAVAFWLLFAPNALLHALDGFSEMLFAQTMPTNMAEVSANPVALAVSIPLAIGVIYASLWGQACVLVIGKRMINSPAGRNRTSFAAVREQSRKYIFPLFVTQILRSCIGLLWMLALIVPGIIYGVRTVFYDILIVSEDAPYGREALRRSIALVKGRTGEIFWSVLVIGIAILVPAGISGELIIKALTLSDERLGTLGILISDAIGAYAGMFFMLCVIALFAELKKAIAPIGSPSKAKA